MTTIKPLLIMLFLIILVWTGYTTAAATQGNVLVTGNPEILLNTINSESYRTASLREFIGMVKDGRNDHLVGVYVAGTFALPVVQQPNNDPAYVSNQPNTITQFGLASNYGTTGLLAHNTLSGELFSRIGKSSVVILVYGDGSTRQYQVLAVHKYQALSPHSPYSNFVSLDQPDQEISSSELFSRIYKGADQVVFQTCISKNGEPSWGRMFITAKVFTLPLRSRATQYSRILPLSPS